MYNFSKEKIFQILAAIVVALLIISGILQGLELRTPIVIVRIILDKIIQAIYYGGVLVGIGYLLKEK